MEQRADDVQSVQIISALYIRRVEVILGFTSDTIITLTLATVTRVRFIINPVAVSTHLRDGLLIALTACTSPLIFTKPRAGPIMVTER
jgi:hypothetical protein